MNNVLSSVGFVEEEMCRMRYSDSVEVHLMSLVTLTFGVGQPRKAEIRGLRKSFHNPVLIYSFVIAGLAV